MSSGEGSSVRYPKGVLIDFNKLERHALMKLLKHYGVNPKVGSTHSELAVMAAKSFESSTANEPEVITKFSHSNLRTMSDHSSRVRGGRYSRFHLDAEPAKIGEQVRIFPCTLV